MTRKICDTCRKEVPPDQYGLPPMGWLTLSIRGAINQTDYCSFTCAVQDLLRRETEATAVATKAA